MYEKLFSASGNNTYIRLNLSDLLLYSRRPHMISCDCQSAKQHLIQLSQRMRAYDVEAGLSHSAVADLLLLYGHTTNWFQALREYKASCKDFTSQVEKYTTNCIVCWLHGTKHYPLFALP